jgi:hypothetical protein
VLEQGHAAPAARVPAGEFRRRVSPACIAPTLAELMHVPPPGGCVEEPLFELLPRPSRSRNEQGAPNRTR